MVLDDSRAESAKETAREYKEKLVELGKSPAAEQVLVGGAAGLAAGFAFARFGRNAALAIFAAVLVLQVAVHRRYVTIDWKNLQGTSQAAREKLAKYTHGGPTSSLLSAKHFIVNNTYFLISFAAGFIVGLGTG